MTWLKEIWRRLTFYWRQDQFDRELEEEMRFHLEMKTEDNLAAGMETEEARYAARRQFGNQTLLREVVSEMWRFKPIETLFQDLRYGMRMLLKQKGFTAVAMLTLGLGIGANTAIFSVVNAVLIRSLPFRNPDRIVMVWENFCCFSEEDYVGAAGTRLHRDETTGVRGISLGCSHQMSLAGDRPETLRLLISLTVKRSCGIPVWHTRSNSAIA